jgi:hypothetical protein
VNSKRQQIGSTPTAHDFVGLVDKLGVSDVDCCLNCMEMVKETSPDSVVDCGIVDLPHDDCSTTAATYVVHQGIRNHSKR